MTRSELRAGTICLDTASAYALSLCVWARVLDHNEALTMPEMVSVAVQKRGRKFFNPWEGSVVWLPDVTLHESLGKLVPV